MLAFAADEVVADVVGKRFRRYGPNTLPDGDALLAELEGIRVRGVAYDREESTRGVACVAAPVRSADGEIQGGISLTGHVSEIDCRRLTPIVQTAARIVGRKIDQDVITQKKSAEAMMSMNPGEPRAASQ